ncbi:hypothetical protein MA16_Dca003953 [Dendrobium catenatum]|uniref:Uncharacterized protein n=1 Tax=Dendrobium catenatum TaxID=906689 RepID=A0A2I0X1Z5_9ASPA|nr:hypothetical protein MA16_Dca003953 [Dendrobium catenatum]
MFLQQLRNDGKYIVEMEDGDNGLLVFVKYESNDGLLDFLQIYIAISFGHYSFVEKVKFVTKKCAFVVNQSHNLMRLLTSISGFLRKKLKTR